MITESKQSSEGREVTKAGKEVPGRDKVTPVEAQNVKRGMACLGKQEFGLPSYKRVEGDETNLEGRGTVRIPYMIRFVLGDQTCSGMLTQRKKILTVKKGVL